MSFLKSYFILQYCQESLLPTLSRFLHQEYELHNASPISDQHNNFNFKESDRETMKWIVFDIVNSHSHQGILENRESTNDLSSPMRRKICEED